MASLTEDLVPAPQGGAHSTVGRATNRGMDKMRAIAIELEQESKQALEVRKEAAERIAAERAQGITGGMQGLKPAAKAAGHPPGTQETAPAPKKKPTGGKHPVPLDKTSTPMGRAVRERLNLNPGSQEPGIGQKEPQSPAGLSPVPDVQADQPTSPTSKRSDKASPAFTNQGPADQVFSETARTQLKRHFLQDASSKTNPYPEVGHYRVQDNLMGERIKVMDFGYRPKHESRYQKEIPFESLGPQDLVALDITFTKSGSLFAHPMMFSTSTMSSGHEVSMNASTSSWKGQSLMSTATERAASTGGRMALESGVRMTDVVEPGNPEDQDCNTSAVRRNPEFDIKRQTARGSFFGKGGCEHFEVGKYNVNLDANLPTAKKQIGFNQQMSRSVMNIRGGNLASLDSSSKGNAHMIDRSAYRNACRNRTTHVMEMTKDLDRPPLIKVAKALHDESDPEVSRLVHERAMGFDADTVDKAVRTRADKLVLAMGRELSRDGAGHGARISQGNVSIRAKGSSPWYETQTQWLPMEQLKDSIRTRSDIGLMTFDQCKARGPTRLKGKYSALHRPRHHAAPDFSRAPPFNGFDSRTPVSRSLKVHPRSRSHDAMPGWSADIVDDLMTSDVDGV